MKRKIIFVVPPAAHLLDLSGPVQIFHEAKEAGAPIQLLFSNMLVDQLEVKSSAGLFLTGIFNFNVLEADAHDFIFIPGCEANLLLSDTFRKNTSSFREWLLHQYQRGVFICSVCTGAFILADTGLLNGKKCTTHWRFFDSFQARYPKISLQANRLFIEEDRILSSAGVSSGIDMALFLVEKMMGPAFAAKIAREVVIYLRRSEDDPQLSVFLQFRNHLEDRIHQVQDYLAQHLQKKMTIDQLADLASMSPRNLTRLFKTATGITIGDYMQKLRMEKAAQLLAEGNKMSVVADACGLKVSQLREIIKTKLS
jgi:transcriptional regulator GlxA family with amidase domain